ncbi:Interleukin-1 receptor-associated kinase 4 [Armadillidium vulgare]|nr:Interleukin-1 receptor-associated kinase 4 [Armadillidium vulgare]
MNSEARTIERDLELRHLPKQIVSKLGNILQVDHSWKDVMCLIPDNPWVPGQDLPSGNFSQKYSSEQISLVADECVRSGRTGFEVLIEEWGTSGFIRPKVMDLIKLLKQAGLERAADYLEKTSVDKLTATFSRAFKINTDTQTRSNAVGFEQDSRETLSNAVGFEQDSREILSNDTFETLKETNIPFIPFDLILDCIKNGCKIGEGAFGFVFKSHLLIEEEKKTVAIKMLSENEAISRDLKKEDLFKNEVEILSKCNHKNIIKLEGYSFRNTELGLIYSYMKNGSLYDRLSCIYKFYHKNVLFEIIIINIIIGNNFKSIRNDTPPLSWKQRLDIGKGAAEGIVYLHTNFNPPLVHRDIKSPNILLDENFTPKLGDFGIVRLGSYGKHTSTSIRTTAVGTQMYMAPEAFRGDVSVMLELLTGLQYYDETRENWDILSYVQEWEGDEVELLDTKAGDWDIEIGRKLFEYTETCTREKRERPDMVNALNMLNSIIDNR